MFIIFGTKFLENSGFLWNFHVGSMSMYKNKALNGQNSICGVKVKEYRKNFPEKTSQRKFADMLQVAGLDIDKNAVQRIECGKRFVTDIELKTIADVLGVSYQELLDD